MKLIYPYRTKSSPWPRQRLVTCMHSAKRDLGCYVTVQSHCWQNTSAGRQCLTDAGLLISHKYQRCFLALCEQTHMAWILLSLTCIPQYYFLRLMNIVMWSCRSFTVGERRYKCEGERSKITPMQWIGMLGMTRKIFAFPSCICWKDLEAMIPQKQWTDRAPKSWFLGPGLEK